MLSDNHARQHPQKEETMRLVQLIHPEEGRRVGVVDDMMLWLLKQSRTVYDCAQAALSAHASLQERVRAEQGDRWLDYEAIYADRSPWQLLPSFDHPDEPARCLVSGTGLTHRKGAANRNAMHQEQEGVPGLGMEASEKESSDVQEAEEPAVVMTDSMKMYAWGEAGGKPEAGGVGVQPEWFYKGNGTILRAHGEPLDVPAFAEDGGEEAEVAGVYLIDSAGHPRRLGFVIGNEFSDHRMEKRNYLYLAPSKLRTCAIGPELALDADFEALEGTVRILRDKQELWSETIATGESHMVHSLANLEHHHFKYPAHRHPGDVHIHFFGTGAFSFGAGVALEEGDVMTVDLPALGRALRNPIRIDPATETLTTVTPL
jgi:hypothetical protein